MFLMASARLIAVIILTLFVCTLSHLIKRAFIAITVSGAVTLLPTAIGAVGVVGVQRLDYTRFISFTPMYMDASVASYAVICFSIASVGIAGMFFMEQNYGTRRTV